MRRLVVMFAVLFLSAGLFAEAQTTTAEKGSTPVVTAKKTTTKAYVSSASKAHKGGGFMGFLVGCCLGPRTAGEYNEGKKIHWREWVHLVASPWAGYEGYKGKTRSDYVNQYGSEFF